MKNSKREALEADGWKIGNANDFLDLTDEEKKLIDDRAGLEIASQSVRIATDSKDIENKQ